MATTPNVALLLAALAAQGHVISETDLASAMSIAKVKTPKVEASFEEILDTNGSEYIVKFTGSWSILQDLYNSNPELVKSAIEFAKKRAPRTKKEVDTILPGAETASE